MSELPPANPPRIVKPRTPKHVHRPIVAVTERELLIESGGLILPARQLAHVLVSEPSSIIACQGFGPHLNLLREVFQDNPNPDSEFQYRVTPRFDEQRNKDDGRQRHLVRIQDAVTNFVGFRNANKGNGGKRWTRYHYPIDPLHFIRQSIDNLYPEDESRLYRLMRFAQEVREWCQENQLEVRASAGGLAAQLLRDPRFYPEPRRKIPSTLNNSARYQLPGNYYRLHASESPATYDALYLDMSNAHHEAAKELAFPDANTLHAYGRWQEREPLQPFLDVQDKPSELLVRPGLFRVQLTAPDIASWEHPPPFMARPGSHEAWLYSNELEMVDEWGGEITGVHAAIVSHRSEDGLNRYAKFAIGQIAKYPAMKPWLKPTLHALYGILAARANRFETGYLRAEGKNLIPTEYPMGRVSVPVLARRSSTEIESSIVNVIHRGMIEAEVRKQVLQFALRLHKLGASVLAVYADSIFVETGGDTLFDDARLPELPRPWRIAQTCTNLRFLSPVHFVSDQESRLPGIPKNQPDAARADRLMRRAILIQSAGQTKRSQGGSNATRQAGKRRRANPGGVR